MPGYGMEYKMKKAKKFASKKKTGTAGTKYPRMTKPTKRKR